MRARRTGKLGLAAQAPWSHVSLAGEQLAYHPHHFNQLALKLHRSSRALHQRQVQQLLEAGSGGGRQSRQPPGGPLHAPR